MARPCKSAALNSKKMSKKEREERIEAEKKLRGNNDKINAPEHLTDNQVAIFDFIVEELSASDILGNVDIYMVATCAIAIDRINQIEELINGNSELLLNKTLLSAKDKYTKDFFRCSSELSLSPQARAKVNNINQKAKEDAEDPLLKILFGDDNE